MGVGVAIGSIAVTVLVKGITGMECADHKLIIPADDDSAAALQGHGPDQRPRVPFPAVEPAR
jgi:hypothetical protein